MLRGPAWQHDRRGPTAPLRPTCAGQVLVDGRVRTVVWSAEVEPTTGHLRLPGRSLGSVGRMELLAWYRRAYQAGPSGPRVQHEPRSEERRVGKEFKC